MALERLKLSGFPEDSEQPLKDSEIPSRDDDSGIQSTATGGSSPPLLPLPTDGSKITPDLGRDLLVVMTTETVDVVPLEDPVVCTSTTIETAMELASITDFPTAQATPTADATQSTANTININIPTIKGHLPTVSQHRLLLELALKKGFRSLLLGYGLRSGFFLLLKLARVLQGK